MHSIIPKPNNTINSTSLKVQSRKIHLSRAQTYEILRSHKIFVTLQSHHRTRAFRLEISIDRSQCQPYLSIGELGEEVGRSSVSCMFYYGTISNHRIRAIAKMLQLDGISYTRFIRLLGKLLDLFMGEEAIYIETIIAQDESNNLSVQRPRIEFDDKVYKRDKFSDNIPELQNSQPKVPEELEAEKDGIVYIKYDFEKKTLIPLLTNWTDSKE